MSTGIDYGLELFFRRPEVGSPYGYIQTIYQNLNRIKGTGLLLATVNGPMSMLLEKVEQLRGHDGMSQEDALELEVAEELLRRITPAQITADELIAGARSFLMSKEFEDRPGLFGEKMGASHLFLSRLLHAWIAGNGAHGRTLAGYLMKLAMVNQDEWCQLGTKPTARELQKQGWMRELHELACLFTEQWMLDPAAYEDQEA